MPLLMLSNASANAAGGESDCRSGASAGMREDMCVWNSSSSLESDVVGEVAEVGEEGVATTWNTKSIG